MSTRRKMADAATRHQIYLQRYAGSHAKQLLAFVKQLQKQALELIPITDNPLTKARYVKVVSAFKDLSSELIKVTQKGMLKDFKGLISYEADFTKRIIDQSVNLKAVPFETAVPAAAQLQSAAFTSVISTSVPGLAIEGGVTAAEALSGFGRKTAGNIVKTIRDGYALGSTTKAIANGIEAVTGGKLVNSQALTVARTITNHLASTAREAVYEENSDIITGYQVVATLDDRTTITCAALDGQVFDVNDFDKPPYHWNCRTTYIGVVDPKYSISFKNTTRPAKGSDEEENSAPATSTYNSWLKNQSEAFQNDVLGKGRADMFRAGTPLYKFVDENYTPYTLDELRAQDEQHN